MLKYRLIFNPAAGRGTSAQLLPRIERLLTGYGLNFDLARTERPWHAAELARGAAQDECDVVVAVGGDGTVNEVLNGLMTIPSSGNKNSRPALGVLCTGQGNDFAYGMGIPTDLEAGCTALARGYRRTVDVGHVMSSDQPKGRYFGNGIGIGFDAVVGFLASKMTRLSGFPAYLVAVLKTVFLYYKAPLSRIEYDDQVITQPSLMISIMNGRRMGGGFYMAPTGKPDDGLFDLCIAREVNRLRIFSIIPHFLRGTQATQKPIRMARARHVIVTALKGVLPAHADGETVCTAAERLEIELLPSQIEVISSPPEAET